MGLKAIGCNWRFQRPESRQHGSIPGISTGDIWFTVDMKFCLRCHNFAVKDNVKFEFSNVRMVCYVLCIVCVTD